MSDLLRQHEQTDAPARALGGVAAALVALIVCALVNAGLAVWWFEPEGAGERTAPLSAIHPEPEPPVLQVDAAGDLRRLRREQSHQLNSYGWIDHQAGIVHVPLERALDRLLKDPPPLSAEPASLPALATPTLGTPTLRGRQ